MCPCNRFGRDGADSRRSRRSMALVTVLLVIAVLSVTVIAFVLTMQMQRAASLSYSQSFKADQLAQGGVWWIVKELQEEMASESAVDNTGGYPIYRFLYETNANMMPQLVGTNANMVSLLKISTNGTSPYAPGSTLAYANGGVLPSGVRTDAPSLNGRYVDAARWSEACLGNFPANESGDPYWIMVTRSGPKSVTNAATQSPLFSNIQDTNNYVVGRYAYAIYDEGGLIDINLAGYPPTFTDGTSLSAADLARKGSPGLMDLTAIPWFAANPSALQDFIDNWRNPASAASMKSYTNYLYSGGLTTTNGQAGTVLQSTNSFGTTNNYLYVAPGDNLFLSRQDLIAYTQSKGNGMTNILPYVTTFTRDLNAPSFDPMYTKGLKNLNTPTAGGYSGGITELPSSYSTSTNFFNAYLSIIRQPTGRPFVSQRFPLNRLSLFTNGALNAGAISNYFGLTNNMDGYSWSYFRSPSAIASLAQVATNFPARSPDFFETLQASVLQSSLPPLAQEPPVPGPVAWYSYGGAPSGTPPVPWVSEIIMAMGANIIDQYTSDNWPTVINFSNEQYAGNKSVPYLNEFLQWTYRPAGNLSNIMMVCPVEYWNPYQNSANNPASVSGPTNFRTIIEPNGATNTGFTNVFWNMQGLTLAGTWTNHAPNTVTNYWQPVNWYNPNNTPDANKPYVTFTNSTVYREPTLLTNITGSSGTYWTNYVENAQSISGFFVGLATNLPDERMYTNVAVPTNNYLYHSSGLIAAGSGDVDFQMQFQDTNGNWHPYQGYSANAAISSQITPIGFTVAQGAMAYRDDSRTTNLDLGITGGTACFTNFNYMVQSAGFADPRSYLGGIQYEAASPNYSVRPFTTTAGVQKGRNGDYPIGYSYPYLSSGGSAATPYSPFEGMLNENWPNNPLTMANSSWTIQTNTYIYDMDGILRPGDGYLGTNANPYIANNANSFAARPILLNRPFRSVGEMGFAFRGQAPWKSINFFSTNSADTGMLDLFGNDPAPLVAGKVNLNTRQPVTIQAALQGAYKTEQINSQSLTTVSTTEASNFAQAIVNQAGLMNYVNRADLVRQFATNSAYTTYFSNPNDAVLKSHREAIIRPLAELGTTRTWNLMIDVVAQVGHYPANASTLYPGDLSKFIVEGERRYWLHVAIDRITGQVIDYKLELYNE